jgi:predicted Zn-dependent protease
MNRFAMVCLLAGLLAPMVGATAGCTRVPATGERVFNMLSWEEEVALGQEAAPEMESEFGGRHPDLALQAYVRTVGERVARSAQHEGMPELPYTFAVLDSEVVNAFALPGGPVYVTRGLLELMESEAELAAVLGHEISHVNLRHSAQQISRQMGFQVLLAAASAAAGGESSGEAIEALGKVVVGLVSLKYSRGMESEADRFGLDYMAAAGYHPQGMVELLTVFTEMEGGRSPEFLSTHPNPENRVGTVQQIIHTKYEGQGGRTAADEYNRQVLRRIR